MGPKMLERLTKALPLISLGAFTIFSIFNVGYFWHIGLHFIGVVDISNLVYSFGLALVALVVFSQLAGLTLGKRDSLFRILVMIVIGGAVSMLGILGLRSLFRTEV